MISSILFICLGNICRSPMAEGVMRQLAGNRLKVDSAGTGNWHAGDTPDSRAQAVAAARGYDISAQRARQVCADDFTRFDLILAMDARNLADIAALPAHPGTAKLAQFLPFAGLSSPVDVPDPWYTGDFDGVLDLIETACTRILKAIK
jgi:protein-tyrosine phosphatase